jgi:hypothetical protein
MAPDLRWKRHGAHPTRRARILSGLVVAIFLGQFLSPLVMQPLIDAA